MKLEIGQIYSHEGKRFQIMSIKDNLVIAHSYGDDCGVETSIYLCKKSARVIATRSKLGRRKPAKTT